MTIAGGLRSRLAAATARPTMRRVLGNFSWLMAERLTSLGVALLVTIPVARYLGAHEFGTLSFALAIFGLVGPVSQFGLADIVTKELIARPGDEDRILGTVVWLRRIGALIGLACVAGWLAIDPPADHRAAWYAVSICTANLIGSMTVLQFWSLANGTIRYFTISQMASTAIVSVARLALVVSGAGLAGFAAIAAIEVLLQGAFAYLGYRRAERGRAGGRRAHWRWDGGLARTLLGRSWPMTLSAISAAIYLKLDLVMLANYRGATETGWYAAAARISEIWYFVPILIATALFPTLIDLRRQSPERYRRRLQDVMDVLAAAGMVLAVLVSFAAPLIIGLLFGPSFAPAAAILSVHIWAGVFIFMRSLAAKWMVVEDLYVLSLVGHVTGAIANIVLNIVLIPRFGGLGAAWATLISYAAASFLWLLVSSRTRPMFVIMCRSLLWPIRIGGIVRALGLRG